MKRVTPTLIPVSLTFYLSAGCAPKALFGIAAASKEADR